MDAERALAERCVDLGERTCAYSALVRRVAFSRHASFICDDDWSQLGNIAAFLAFSECGGDIDDPESFDWYGLDVLRKASRILQKLAIGSQSDIYDDILRTRTRREGAVNDEICWNSWHWVFYNEAQTYDRSNSFQSVVRPARVSTTAHQIRIDMENAIGQDGLYDGLEKALYNALKPQEATWLIRKYRDGVPTSSLAEELVATNPNYQGAGGGTRASRYVDVVVHRAKKKATRALGSRWRELAEGVS